MDIAGILIYIVVGAVTPGPNNLMCMYLGAHCGIRGARRFLIGSVGSVFVKMLLCGLLNLALASVIPGVMPYLKWLGAAYMAYLGVHILLGGIRARREGADTEETQVQGGSRYRDGILLQLLNIKSWIYALSIFSIYVMPYSRSFSSLLLWSGAATLAIAASSLIWIFCGTAIKRLYAKHRILCDSVFCLSLLYCALTAVL